MNLTNLTEQLTSFYQSSPLVIYAVAGLLALLAYFKRKAFFRLLTLLLFLAGVYLVVNQLGQSLDTGIKNKEAMTHSTENALK